MKRSSKCSTLSFRPLNVGIVVDNAFGGLGSPMFCCVTIRKNSFKHCIDYMVWIFLVGGGGKFDDRAVFLFGGTLLSPCVDPDFGATRKYLLVGKMDRVQSNRTQPFFSVFSIYSWRTLIRQGAILDDRFSVILSISL